MHVTGVDVDEKSIKSARSKYSSANLKFTTGKIEEIPFDSNCFDLVICYETLEHIEDHAKALKEIKRVLKTNGLLIISTPDKLYYSDKRNYKNPFHVKELYQEEFVNLVESFFRCTEYIQQQFVVGSLALATKPNPEIKIFNGDFEKIDVANSFECRFQIAIAADVPFKSTVNSVFVGQTVLKESFIQLENSVRNSVTFKVGHFILWPLKKVFNLALKKS